MKKQSLSIYAALVLVAAISAFAYVMLSNDFMAGFELPTPKPVLGLINGLALLILYGALGLLGLFLNAKNSFPELWNEKIKMKLFSMSLIGVVIGVVFIVTDLAAQHFAGMEAFRHPTFPASIFATINAGIGEEIIYRLFFISFWFWLISKIVKSPKGQDVLFWVLAVLSAIGFAVAHFPSVMFLYGWQTVSEIPGVLTAMIIGLNGLLGIACAYWFKRYGFLAAVLIHFWVDAVWHILYGAFA